MDLDILENFLEDDCIKNNKGVLVHKRTGRRIAALMIVHVQGKYL